MKYFTKNRQPETRLGRRKKLLELKTPICDHREGMVGDDITLYYPGFQRFIDQCNDITLIPTREECTLIQHMCTYMPKYMPVGRTRQNGRNITKIQPETIRQDIFMKLMNQFLENPIVTSDDEVKQFYENDTRFVQNGMMKRGGGRLDGYIDPCKCVILEVKNESGQGGSDSYEQVIAYYVKTLKDKQVSRCPAPAFLLELVGPHLFISGAVYGKYVFVDKLIDPVLLVPQHNDDAMIRIARIFKALKRAIAEIQGYYYEEKPPVSQPRFPIFQSFYKGKIQYEEAIKPHMFKGTLTYYNGTCTKVVIVMFVKQYSCETHELMAFHGHAPQLIHYEERVGGTQYTAIVMEYIPDARPLDEFFKYAAANYSKYINNIKKIAQECCTEALKVMHDNGFCHGKISSKSILGKVQGKELQIFIVNYKWAGRQGEARYPLSADIPEGVQPGYPITREQDLAQLEKLFPDNESEGGDEQSDE